VLHAAEQVEAALELAAVLVGAAKARLGSLARDAEGAGGVRTVLCGASSRDQSLGPRRGAGMVGARSGAPVAAANHGGAAAAAAAAAPPPCAWCAMDAWRMSGDACAAAPSGTSRVCRLTLAGDSGCSTSSPAC
jgi:hypothetical protein